MVKRRIQNFSLKLAYETGVQLRQLREVKHSLEDIFAEMMGVDSQLFND